MDASTLIKPVLANGELRCIGSTTYSEFRGIFEKDHALARRFQKIDVVEPSIEETTEILRGLKSRFEEHHGVVYADDALAVAAELASRHINDRNLPDKAIDVIDEAGANCRLQPPSERKRIVDVDLIQKLERIAGFNNQGGLQDFERLDAVAIGLAQPFDLAQRNRRPQLFRQTVHRLENAFKILALMR